MAKSCAIIPRILNNKGEIVDSKLFQDIDSFTKNRKDTIRLYLTTKSDDFIEKYGSRLKLDNNGEPLLKDLLKVPGFDKIIPDSKIVDRLNRDIGYYKKGTDKPRLIDSNDINEQELKQKAIAFNNNSEFSDDYVANIVRSADPNTGKSYIGVKVEKRNKENSLLADRMEYNENLNNRLRAILNSHGISIGALTELERQLGINGVTDFDIARAAAEGTIEMIRLAHGKQGEKALPEEFAHFAIRALGNNPLVNRLINIISKNGLEQEIFGDDYDTYSRLYEGNRDKMVEEAAGKLLAKHLLQQESIPAKPYKNILQRLIQAVKNFFKNIDATPIQRAIRDADKGFGNLAKQILDGSLDRDISIDNIDSNGVLYNTSERVARDRKLLSKIIDNELKRLKIYKTRNPKSNFDVNQQLFIDKLELALEEHQEIEGIYSFVDNALTEMAKVKNRLVSLSSTPATNINERARVLRNVRNYLFSYKHIIDEIRSALNDEEALSDNRYGQRIRNAVDNTAGLFEDLFDKYNKMAMPLFIDFLKPFMGESITVPFGKWKGKTLTVEDFVKGLKRDSAGNIEWYQEDISFFNRWLDSMADSTDYTLKLMDQAVKRSKETARMNTLDTMKEIQAATLRLEQSGISDTSWMFERDEDGNLTGNYISEINQGLFKQRLKAMYNTLNEKYGKNPIGEDAEKYKKERSAWFNANMETVNGKRVPKKSIYGNKDFQNLNEAQREYYNKIMDIKARLDSYLPENVTTLNNAVKIRKDLLERIKSSSDIITGAKQIWESIKDSVIRRSDDTDFGGKRTIKDFEGKELQSLPIYYIKMKKGESANDLSTDVASTLIAYAAMANEYNEMNKVIDVLELGRDILRERELVQTRGNKPLMESFKSVGRRVESLLTNSGEATRTIQRLNDFFQMQVYNRYYDDEGTFGNTRIDKAKAADLMNQVTALNTLAINILSGISNVATGTVMMRIESMAGEFFNESNTLRADRNYSKALMEYLPEIGNRVKVSKLALWDELFDVLQEYDSDIKETNFDRKTWFSRMFGPELGFLTNSAGEHWMQNRTSLALADAYKMKTPDGKIVSLWDAMEVVPIDEKNKKLGAKLQVKKGYTKEDSTQFTKEDIIAFSRRTTAINERMHGIYNRADRSAIQKTAVGRMAMMFRKWVKPSLNRRFQSLTYNYDLKAWTEGYYTTMGRFMWGLAKDLRQGQYNVAAHWKDLTKTEKANVRRAITEVAHYLAIVTVLGLVDWDDKNNRPWLEKMAEYQLRRLQTEVGVLIPGKPMADEGLKILKSPAAAIQTMQSTLDLVGLINPMNYETFAGEDALIQSGQFKDKSKAYRLLMKSPLMPMRSTITRGIDPNLAIPYFNQQ